MKFKTFAAIFTALSVAIFFSGCAKEEISIGKGNPDEEIKQCLRFSQKGKHEDAIQCLEMFKARYPQTAYGQEAELLIGDSYFARKDYLLAAESYAAFLRLYPLHPKADYAHYKIGVCYYKESPKAIDRDQEYLQEAIVHLRAVVRSYPGSQYRKPALATLHAARKRIARRNFYIGRFYYRTGEYIAAIPRFYEVANQYPDSGLADKALYLIIESNLGLSRVEAARDAFSELSANYSNSKYVKKAERKMLKAVKK
ncbi:MAG: outer membrane protein assembly factor BamD [Pseudomonadota bacterium]